MTTGATEGREEIPGALPQVAGAASVTGRTDHTHSEAERLVEEIDSRGNMMAALSRVVANKGDPASYPIEF